MDCTQLLEILEGPAKTGVWAQRISAELGYLTRRYTETGRPVPGDILLAMESLCAAFRENGAITKADTLAAEKSLSAYQGEAKEIRLWCTGHAHIDMNWMWGFQETVGITIDTFQTVLNLMEEYPDFVFAQSQASTYEIIETYCPSMLPEIARRIREGRWEITATQWVEGDKNMAGTEALCRHILYTKAYLSRLFGIRPEELELDFEPDTFGHSENVPELLRQGGVRYLYHCRGYQDHIVYRWQAPSGAEVLVFRDPEWYLGAMEWDFAKNMPMWAQKAGTNELLWLYGMGDHGGGPTRRDLEMLLEMRTWPLMPEIRFGRLHDYFHTLERDWDKFPVVRRELNYVFTGCYTSQSRVKLMNRMGEDRLGDSEALCAMASLWGDTLSQPALFAPAWQRVLFNQFHDILPGSGVPETYQYAAGRYQEAMAAATANANRAMRVLCGGVDTGLWESETPADSVAEGAGVGCYVMQTPSRVEVVPSVSGFGETNRAGGTVRPYTLLNPTQYARDEAAELSLWDWPLPMEKTELTDGEGAVVPFSVLHEDAGAWACYGHHHRRIAFRASVPAFGWANYYIRRARTPGSTPRRDEPRVHSMEDGCRILENDRIRAVFESVTMRLVSLVDLETGRELVDSKRPAASFRYVEERDVGDYSAWVVGPYGHVEDLNETSFVRVTQEHPRGQRAWFDYEIHFHSSSVKVRVSLGAGERTLRFSVTADFHETQKDTITPQLQFYVPVGYAVTGYRYDVPGGILDRPPLGHDVPALTFAAALPEGGVCAALTSDCKYGFRGCEDGLILNLIRGGHQPDPYPDLGLHQIEIGLMVTGSDADVLTESAVKFSHPVLAQSNSVHTGCHGQRGSILSVTGARVYAVKRAEDGNGLILRLGNSGEQPVQPSIVLLGTEPATIGADLCEDHAAPAQPIPPHAIRTMRITERHND